MNKCFFFSINGINLFIIEAIFFICSKQSVNEAFFKFLYIYALFQPFIFFSLFLSLDQIEQIANGFHFSASFFVTVVVIIVSEERETLLSCIQVVENKISRIRKKTLLTIQSYIFSDFPNNTLFDFLFSIC